MNAKIVPWQQRLREGGTGGSESGACEGVPMFGALFEGDEEDEGGAGGVGRAGLTSGRRVVSVSRATLPQPCTVLSPEPTSRRRVPEDEPLMIALP